MGVGVWKWKGVVGGRRGEGEGLTRLGLALGCDVYAHSLLPLTATVHAGEGNQINPPFIYLPSVNLWTIQCWFLPKDGLTLIFISLTTQHQRRTTLKSLAHLSTCLSSRLLPAHRTGRITAPWRGTNAINPTSKRHTSHCQ